jgi:chemotaxis protein methyltransferase WspC
MNQIEDLLREKIGLQAATLGRSLVEQAVAARVRVHGLANLDGYLQLLRELPGEWKALVEAVVVTETWFFRDREPFRAMVKFVRQEWIPAHPSGKLRVLSVPCSTGEEPYSVAMALLDAEIPGPRFQIDAVDIRSAAIAHAKHAIYGKNSFRGKYLTFRARYFQPVEAAYRLNKSVQEQVRFETGNLLDEQFWREREPYDFIFCRNLLMYFDRASQEGVLQRLNRLLTAAGVLFVGSAEVTTACRCGFASAKLAFSFACRKVPAADALTRRRPGAARSQPGHLPSQPAAGQAKPLADLATARRLAEEGKFAEAANICEDYLRESGASAEAYYLLGRLRDTFGAESEASEFYRKALYLEPDHCETLERWALLSEKSGDGARARILVERAERIRKQT